MYLFAPDYLFTRLFLPTSSCKMFHEKYFVHRLPSYQVLVVDYNEALLFVDFFLV